MEEPLLSSKVIKKSSHRTSSEVILTHVPPQQPDQKFEQNIKLVDLSVGRDQPTQEVNFWRRGEEQLRRQHMVFSLGQETCCINHWFNVLRHHWGGRKVWVQNIDNSGAEGVNVNVLNIQN